MQSSSRFRLFSTFRFGFSKISLNPSFPCVYLHHNKMTHTQTDSNSSTLASSEKSVSKKFSSPLKVSPANLHPEVAKLIPINPCHIHIPVQWGDQDAFGHLNNVIYFRYFETARVDYMTTLSCYLPEEHRYAMLRRTNSSPGPIVSQLTTKFLAQVHFPDVLTYFTRISKLDLQEKLMDPLCDRITLEYEAYSNHLGRKVASGTCLVVCFDYKSNTKTAYPRYLRKAMYELETNQPFPESAN